jgi:NADH:ubiquinone oxidoreductase subunit 5 (subunit L)/multisubunit Na+/H+ antiporter MnhA subunit
MEGPTPVSALIHAATMVTAGIFLMLKMANLFSLNENILNIFGLIGAFTAVFGATTGFAQTDIKKIIAFSTCSQLGYMVAACGMGYFSLAFFHLITHAFFKSLLFLCAGVVIHTLNGEQDIRKMGLLVKILPTAFVSMTIAGLTLSGVPFLSGFYSKELIINIALIGGT